MNDKGMGEFSVLALLYIELLQELWARAFQGNTGELSFMATG